MQSVVPQFIPTEDSGLYMLVSGFEGGEPVEMPVENDGSVLLSNIQECPNRQVHGISMFVGC